MKFKTQYGIKDFNERNHGDYESNDYVVRVNRGPKNECIVDFEYVDLERTDTQCGGVIALEPEAARWLAFALLGAGEKYAPTELTASVENGAVSISGTPVRQT